MEMAHHRAPREGSRTRQTREVGGNGGAAGKGINPVTGPEVEAGWVSPGYQLSSFVPSFDTH